MDCSARLIFCYTNISLLFLAVVVDHRILSMKDVRELAKLQSLEDLRAQTVQILTTQLNQLPMTLEATSQELVSNLTAISNTEGST